MRVVLLGPPGAGKGTQAQIIAGSLGVPAISTGDIFRANVSGQTELGQKAKAYMDAGDLVPDEITVAMVKDRLAEPDAKAGFLLDGFPRTIAQAEQLRVVAGRPGPGLDRVLELVVDEEELVRRLSGRRMLVDGQMVQRDDDKPETVRHRLEVYREQTAPLSGFYESARACSPASTRSVRSRRSRPGRWRRWASDVPGSRARGLTGQVQRDDGRDPLPGPAAREVEWTHDPDQDRRTRSSSCAPPGSSPPARSRPSRPPSAPASAPASSTPSPRTTSARQGAVPNFLGYHGFTGTICASINDEIVHGIPNPDRRLADGRQHLHRLRRHPAGLAQRLRGHVTVGEPSAEDAALLDVTERSMWAGLARAIAGGRLTDISAAVEQTITRRVAPVRDRRPLRRARHRHRDAPGPARAQLRASRAAGPKLVPGLALAIEPMVTVGDPATVELEDGWTVVTKDGSRAAHFEHTVAITPEGPWVLTAEDGGVAGLAPFGITPRT